MTLAGLLRATSGVIAADHQSSSFGQRTEIERHDYVVRRFPGAPRSACERAGVDNMKCLNRPVRLAMAMFAVGSAALATQTQAAELLERAVLPSATFAPGPTSGQFATGA